MATLSKGGSVFQANILTIKEGDLVTKAYKVQDLDLVIEQARGENKAYLSHYSNPGICFFTGLMNFLYMNGYQIPLVKEPAQMYKDEFHDSAVWFGGLMAARKFPIEYVYSFDLEGKKPPTATLQVFYQESKPPELQINTRENGRAIIISTDTAQKLIRGIPKIYPYFNSFHTAYLEFLKVAKTHQENGEFPRTVPAKERAKQLEFELLRKTPLHVRKA